MQNRTVRKYALIGSVTLLGIGGSLLSHPRTARADQCKSSCYPCDDQTVLYSNGHGPKGFTNPNAPDIEECLSGDCSDICSKELLSSADSPVGLLKAAVHQDDERAVEDLVEHSDLVRINRDRNSVQVMSPCNRGLVVASFAMPPAEIAQVAANSSFTHRVGAWLTTLAAD